MFNGPDFGLREYVAENKIQRMVRRLDIEEPYRVKQEDRWVRFGTVSGKLPRRDFYRQAAEWESIRMCKAFDECRRCAGLEWTAADVAVQAAGCAPVVKAWEAQKDSADFFANAATMASGLRVPGRWATE